MVKGAVARLAEQIPWPCDESHWYPLKSVWNQYEALDPSEAEDLKRGKGKAANVFWQMDFSFLRIQKQTFCVNVIEGNVDFANYVLQQGIEWKATSL